MNWIKQNKFEAGLLLVVILAAVGIFLYGNSQGKAYDEAKERFDSADSQVITLEGGAPFPNDTRASGLKYSMGSVTFSSRNSRR